MLEKPKTKEELEQHRKEVLNKALEDKLQEGPEQVAIKIYDTLLPQFDLQLQQLSKKGLQRVLNALVKVPLIQEPNLDKLEKNVYSIVDRLIEAKFIMISHVINEELKEAEEVSGEEFKEIVENKEIV